jgi:hypothetical protein
VRRVRFFFDWGAGTALWADGAGAVDLAGVPVSDRLRQELGDLAAEYDTALNWDYPPDPGPWREARCAAFNARVRAVLERLRAELGPAWAVVDEYADLHEDPDLDRYLADPAGFRRR